MWWDCPRLLHSLHFNTIPESFEPSDAITCPTDNVLFMQHSHIFLFSEKNSLVGHSTVKLFGTLELRITPTLLLPRPVLSWGNQSAVRSQEMQNWNLWGFIQPIEYRWDTPWGEWTQACVTPLDQRPHVAHIQQL